jgi:hypothetical protein
MCRKRYMERRGKDDVRTYEKGRVSRRGMPLVRLVREIWQFFQNMGEEVMIRVWVPQ